MIPIKTEAEILIMRESCRIAAFVLEQIIEKVAPGVSAYDLDQYGKELFESCGAKSACYDYRVGNRRFPAYTCLSVNEEVVHGIGRPDRKLALGDTITVDVCALYEGFIGDNARTVAVGPVSDEVQFLLRSTEESLHQAIKQARPGNRVGDISSATQKYVEQRNLSIVRDFVGHGVGRSMHEEPQIPNFGKPGTGKKLKPGMTLAIEPMVNLGSSEVEIARDGWTAITRDRRRSAHFEHTVLIVDDGAEILTLTKK